MESYGRLQEQVMARMNIKYCCKCRPIVFCIRTRKVGKGQKRREERMLEAWCEGHAPLDINKHHNVEILTESEFKSKAGYPELELPSAG